MATNIEISLLADIKDAVSAIKTFQKQATDSLGVVEKATKKTADASSAFKQTVTAVGAAFAGIAAAKQIVQDLAGALAAPIRSAAESEVAVNNLNSALAQTGRFSSSLSQEFQDLADSIQATSTVSDESVLSITSQLAALTKLDNEGLKKATQATVDFAATTGKSIEESRDIFVKAANGNITALTRFGIEIKKGANDVETFNNALEALANQQGAAANKTLTFEGSIQRFTNVFDNFLETIGKGIVENDAVILVINQMSEAFKILTKFVSNNSKEIAFFVGVALATFVDILADAVAAVDLLIATLRGLGQSFKEVSNIASASIKLIKDTIDVGPNKAIKDFKESLDDSGKAIQSSFNKTTVLTNFSKTLGNVSQQVIDATGKQATGFRKVNEQLINASKNAKQFAKDVDENVSKALEESVKKIKSGDIKEIIAVVQLAFQGKVDTKQIGAIAGQVGGAISQGAEGARKVISGVIGELGSNVLKAFGPIGAIAGELFKSLIDLFSKGPEETRKMVREFVGAIPEVVKNIVRGVFTFVTEVTKTISDSIKDTLNLIPFILESIVTGVGDILTTLIDEIFEIPQIIIDILPKIIDQVITILNERVPEIIENLIEKLEEGAPTFITSLVNLLSLQLPFLATKFSTALAIQAPFIAIRLSLALQTQAPFIAIAIAKGFITEIPTIAREMGTAIAEEFRNAVKGVTGGVSNIGKTASNFAGKVKGIFGFAEGGQIIQGTTGKDSVPALLGKGELVVDRSLTNQLADFLNSNQQQEQVQDQSPLIALLSSINSKLGKQNITVQVGNKEIVSVIRESLESGRVLA